MFSIKATFWSLLIYFGVAYRSVGLVDLVIGIRFALRSLGSKKLKFWWDYES